MTIALVKASLYLACILLVGAGVTRLYVHPVPTNARLSKRLRWGAFLGAAALLAGSALDVLVTLRNVLGSVDADLVGNYLANTRHGRATLARLALVVPVLLLALPKRNARSTPAEAVTASGGRASRLGRALYATTSLALLATFSWTSHAAAMGGTPPLLADLVHFGAAAAWAGPILYLALQPDWHRERPDLATAFRRVSRIGLASVLLLFATGAYTASIHMQNPETFVASAYGEALGTKLLIVLVIVEIAALNRFWLLPAFLDDGPLGRFRNAVRLEAGLLVVVFLVTGMLATSALPHEPGLRATAMENLGGFLRFLTGGGP